MRRLISRHSTYLKIGVLAGLGLYFAYIYVSGRWALYIDPRFKWLSVIAVVLFAVLALSYRSKSTIDEHHHHPHDHMHEPGDHEHSHVTLGAIFIVALPLVLGVLIPAKPLGASAIKTRGIDTDLSSVSVGRNASTSLTVVASEKNILDWVRTIASTPDPTELIGQEADVIGFVYRDSRFDENQFMVARFTLSCCVADALAIGLVVQLPEDSSTYAADSWVRVEGHFEERSFDNAVLLVLVADVVTPVEQPDQPYLYQ